MENKQLTLADAVVGLGRRTKVSKAVRTLGEIDRLVDWRVLAEIVNVLDKSGTGRGGRRPNFSESWNFRSRDLQPQTTLLSPISNPNSR